MVAVMMTFAICVLRAWQHRYNGYGYGGAERENKAKVGAALENLPVREQKKVLVPCTQEK